MIPSDPSQREGQRVDEWSIVRFDGRRQDVTMRLESSTALDRAALILPLPTQARFALGHDAVFDDMAEKTKPRVETKKRYKLFGAGGNEDDGGGGATEGAAPTAGAGGVEVVGTQDLGPLRVVTLRGDDAAIVETWLEDNGYEPPEGLAGAAQRYLDANWLLAAVKLRSAGGEPIRRLQPLIISFDVERPVYPLMQFPDTPAGLEARVDVVAPEPVEVQDRPMDDVPVNEPAREGRLYAGPEPNGRYLTSFRFLTGGPGSRPRDAVFVQAERRDFQQVRTVYEDVDVTGWAVAGTLVGVLLGGTIAFLIVRRRNRAA
jgi:hypothetical protein